MNSPFIARVMTTGAVATLHHSAHDGQVTAAFKSHMLTLASATGPQSEAISLLERVLLDGQAQLPVPPKHDPEKPEPPETEPWPIDRDFTPPALRGQSPARQLELLAQARGGVRISFGRLLSPDHSNPSPALIRVERLESPDDDDSWNQLLGLVAVTKPKPTTQNGWQKHVSIEDPGAAFWAAVGQAVEALWSFTRNPYEAGSQTLTAKAGTL